MTDELNINALVSQIISGENPRNILEGKLKAVGHAIKGVAHAAGSGLALYGGVSAAHAFKHPHKDHPEAVRFYQAKAKKAVDAANLTHAKHKKDMHIPHDADVADKITHKARNLPGGDIANVNVALGRAKFHDVVSRSKAHAGVVSAGMHALSLHQASKSASHFKKAYKEWTKKPKKVDESSHRILEDAKKAIRHVVKGLAHTGAAAAGAIVGHGAYAGHRDVVKQKEAAAWAKKGWEHGLPDRGVAPKTVAPEHGIGHEGKPLREPETHKVWHTVGKSGVASAAATAGGYGVFFHQGNQAIKSFKKAAKAYKAKKDER